MEDQLRHSFEINSGLCSIDLSEDEWRKFQQNSAEESRFQIQLSFVWRYLRPLFPTIGASDYVLELPIDGDMEEEKADV